LHAIHLPTVSIRPRSIPDVFLFAIKADVIGHKSPNIASRLCLLEPIPKPIGEVLSVGVIFENHLPIDSTNNNVLQYSGSIYSGQARHDE
jgi:hypothetical protein